jgi:hypothetical protein
MRLGLTDVFSASKKHSDANDVLTQGGKQLSSQTISHQAF